MKPTKNHVYCAACGRTKMLFSEQGKADNFIRFNSADIKREKGYCPVRSYYCTYCAGWHITSNSSEEAAKYFETRDEMRMTMYRESRSGISKQEKRTLFRAKFTEICSHIDMLLSMGDISAVEASIDAYKEAEQLLGNSQRSPKADKLEEVIGYVGEAMRLPEEMRQAYLNRLPEEADAKKVCRLVANAVRREQINQIFEQMREADKSGDSQKFNELVTSCRVKISRLSGAHAVKGRKVYKSQLEEIIVACGRKQEEPTKVKKIVEDESLTWFSASGGQEYNETLMNVITNIERVTELYRLGNISECEDLIDISQLLLERMGVNDKNTQLLSRQLEQWEQRVAG